jgi:hypothetical protein
VLPPSALTSTCSTGAHPDHARPRIVHDPGATKRRRVMKSGTPGGIISARGIMRVTSVPVSSVS